MKRPILCAACLFFLLCFFIQNSHYKHAVKESRSALRDETVTIEGYVLSVNFSNESFLLKTQNHRHLNIRFRKNDLIRQTLSDMPYKVSVQIQLKENPFRQTKNAYGIDWDKHAYGNGISGTYTATAIDVIEDTPFSLTRHIIKAKQVINAKINQHYSIETAQFIRAIILGEKGQFEAYDAYKEAGLAHLFAISGLHFGLIYVALKKVILIPVPALKSITIIMCLGMLAIWVGNGYAAQRAFYMIIYYEASYLLHRKPDALTAIALSAFIILALSPYAVLSVSFQMSYYAFFMVALMVKKKSPLKAVQLQLFLMPASLYYFQTANIFSFLANLLFIPIIGVLLPSLMLDLLWVTIASKSLLSWAFDITLHMMQRLLSVLPLHAFSLSIFGSHDYVAVVFLILIYAISMSLRLSKKHIVKTLCLSLLLCILLKDVLLLMYMPNRLRFTDVGHGDMSLVQSGHQLILIDTGDVHFDAVGYLRGISFNKISAIVITHAHRDHYGNIFDILKAFRVDSIFVNEETALKLTDIDPSIANRLTIVNSPMRLSLKKVHLEIIPVFSSRETNDNALVIGLDAPEFKGLYTGDISGHVLEKLPLKTQLDFLKIPHHGSKTSDSSWFYEHYSGSYGIISCGTAYHLPHMHVIDSLNQAHMSWDTTFLKGEFVITQKGIYHYLSRSYYGF